MKAAGPFSAWERALAVRYIGAIRAQSGVALVSAISFVAIALAVFALIVIMSVFNGFRSDMFDRMMGFNGHLYLPPAYLENTQTLARVRSVPGVVSVVPVVEGQTLVRGVDGVTGAIVRGVAAADLPPMIAASVSPREALKTYGQGENGGDEILIGVGMARNLGVKPGEEVTLVSPQSTATAFGEMPNTKTYVVAGVFSAGRSDYDQGFVYMPFTQAQDFMGMGATYSYLETRVTDPLHATDLKPALAHALALSDPDIIQDWTQKDPSFWGAVQVERNLQRLVMMFVIGIAVLNIIAGLIMMVKNKARDIAILRTIGARRGAILRIFLMDGAAIGAGGALCGFVLAILFCANIGAIQGFIEWVTGTRVFNPDVYFLAHVPAKIDWLEVGFAMAFSIGMSFLVTLIPAWFAARTDPVEALRFE